MGSVKAWILSDKMLEEQFYFDMWNTEISG